MSEHAPPPSSPNPSDPAPADAEAAPSPLPRVPVDWHTEPTPVFANVVHAAHTSREFALVFGDVVPFPGRGGFDRPERDPDARIVASLRLTPEGYFDVLRTLVQNWNQFAETRLSPTTPTPRFAIHMHPAAADEAGEPTAP